MSKQEAKVFIGGLSWETTGGCALEAGQLAGQRACEPGGAGGGSPPRD